MQWRVVALAQNATKREKCPLLRPNCSLGLPASRTAGPGEPNTVTSQRRGRPPGRAQQMGHASQPMPDHPNTA